MDTSDHVPMQSGVSQATKQRNTGAASTRHKSRPVPLHIVTRFFHAVRRWFSANTFAPSFLPDTWSHPIFGYLAALLLQLVVIIGIIALTRLYPSFRFREGPLLLVILLVALGWGAGPSIIATLIGAMLLTSFHVPPTFSLAVAQEGDVVGLVLYLIAGLVVSILASQSQRTRHNAEAISTRLETAPLRSPLLNDIEGAVTVTRDLSDLRRAELLAVERASQLEAIFDVMIDGVYVYDREGRIVQLNEASRTFFARVIPADSIVLPLQERVRLLSLLDEEGHSLAVEETPVYRILHGEVLTNEKAVDLMVRVPEDEGIWLNVSGAPLRDGDGQIVGGVAILRDVTERKHAEEQAHFLAEVSKVLTSSLDYRITLSNIARLVVPRLADWFAVDLVDGHGQFELIEVSHKDPKKVQWARELRNNYPVDPDASQGAPNVVRTGKSELYAEITDEMLVASARNEEELAIARQAGYTSAMIVPLMARGKTLGIVTFVSAESGKKYNAADVALAEEVGRRAGVALENARLYREVQEARDQLDIILQGVADGIIVYNTNSQIIYANEAAAQMTDHASVRAMMETPPDGIVARYEIIDEQGQPFSPSQLTHRRVLAGEEEAQAIIGYSSKATGQPERWSLTKSRPVYNEHGQVIYAITIIHDMTERMKAERRKDEFISMASHELKTPVTSLKGFTNVLQRRLTKQGDEQGKYYLSRIDAQLDKLTKLISDLLDNSKIQAGKLEMQVEPFDLDALIQDTVENVQAATSTHHLLIEGKAEAQVMGDQDRIGQVLINLLTNAIKYSPRADKVIIHVSTDEEKKEVIVGVQDFGMGIDDAYHQKIFERFYQVDDPTVKTYPGLGMGLYISHQLVKRHHGRMWVKSRKGDGATFLVALPLYRG